MEKLNVAIADDNEKMVEVLSKIIDQDEDLKLVGKAHNGEEICNIIKEKQPDVVVLDIIMPKVDGLSVMERFSHDENLKKVPSFIVVSAVGQERITEDAFDLGADYFMLKPGTRTLSTVSINSFGSRMPGFTTTGSPSLYPIPSTNFTKVSFFISAEMRL